MDEAAKVIECPCGVVLRGSSEEETIAGAQRHARDNHDMELTHEQALAMTRPA
jgi:predicted small metal-binding protein